jgi:hypothetical protein
MHEVSIEIFDAHTGETKYFTGDELDVRKELRDEYPYLNHYSELQSLEDDLHKISRNQYEFVKILKW